MNAINKCPRCGSNYTEVDEYFIGKNNTVIFRCFCEDCMLGNYQMYWDVVFNFVSITCNGFDPTPPEFLED